MKLRPYQQESVDDIHDAWAKGINNVCLVTPTGGGKSVVISDIVLYHKGGCVVIAHRQELVSQMSLHLAREGIYHNIIGSIKVIKIIRNLHLKQYGKSFYTPSSNTAVAGVDTIIRRGEQLRRFLPTVTLWVIDEAHHHQGGSGDTDRDNKWGKAIRMFTHPNVKGLGTTATPGRLDGKGLGRHSDGCMDVIIEGPKMRWLIDNDYLCDYKIFAPVSDIHLENCKVSKTTGEYTPSSVDEEIKKSSLIVHDKSTQVGDVVQHYLKIAKGKLTIMFVHSMDAGYDLEAQFNNMGITAKLVNAKTPDDERASIIDQFARKELMIMINVALFDEGFDAPAIEVVMDVSPTQSFNRFSQRFGRMLRLLKGKSHGIYIDCVSNIVKHGLPDRDDITWTLDRKTKRSSGVSDTIGIKVCPMCSFVYSKLLKECPDCGHIVIPSNRSSIEEVEGELSELTDEMLAEMRGKVALTDRDTNEQVMEYSQGLHGAIKDIHRRHHEKLFREKVEGDKKLQTELRRHMAYYGGIYRGQGKSDSDIHRRFYLTYNIDWLTAMTLSGDECRSMIERLAVVTELEVL